jgi:hypothetical protein
MSSMNDLVPMSRGGAVANLGNTLLGAGILGLPYAFANTGWVLGTFMLLLCCYFSSTGLFFLSLCAAKVLFIHNILNFIFTHILLSFIFLHSFVYIIDE